ncbi:hypothetical protein [Aquimarina sp. RZ0]|uniref:hypothetical protein n=1 Tax=Aquimarina sp. RZ0 TaxID=2607730 RepID=UPI0011F35597|nr:hypothetical protein [Aquimarina sp. RZ0]KAA1243018.1 hypothetical protein F0000_22920 [Aquimarina sp. RZ0]
MKIDQQLIKEYIEKAFNDCRLEITDHRNNNLILEKGVFRFNNVEQPKSKEVIEGFFLEAFRLSRFLKLEHKKYIRKGSKWTITH